MCYLNIFIKLPPDRRQRSQCHRPACPGGLCSEKRHRPQGKSGQRLAWDGALGRPCLPAWTAQKSQARMNRAPEVGEFRALMTQAYLSRGLGAARCPCRRDATHGAAHVTMPSPVTALPCTWASPASADTGSRLLLRIGGGTGAQDRDDGPSLLQETFMPLKQHAG